MSDPHALNSRQRFLPFCCSSHKKLVVALGFLSLMLSACGGSDAGPATPQPRGQYMEARPELFEKKMVPDTCPLIGFETYGNPNNRWGAIYIARAFGSKSS